jgi:hypothetical protein
MESIAQVCAFSSPKSGIMSAIAIYRQPTNYKCWFDTAGCMKWEGTAAIVWIGIVGVVPAARGPRIAVAPAPSPRACTGVGMSNSLISYGDSKCKA